MLNNLRLPPKCLHNPVIKTVKYTPLAISVEEWTTVLVPGERQEDADAALLLQSRALEFVKKDGKFSSPTLGSLTRKMGMRLNDFNRSSMTSLFTIGAFFRRTWSRFVDS